MLSVTGLNLSGHVRLQDVQAILVRGESKLLKGNGVLQADNCRRDCRTSHTAARAQAAKGVNHPSRRNS